MATRPLRAAPERFFAKVQIGNPDGCWRWIGYTNPGGYGLFRPTGQGRTQVAHRWAWEYIKGPVPEDLTLDHLCRVRNCVNPAHLEPVTMRVNVLRGISPAAQHAQQTHCKHGHEFTPANTIKRTDGGRECRTCARTYHQEYYRQNRERWARALTIDIREEA